VTTYLRRADWTRTAPRKALAALDPDRLRGFAVHWPGSAAPLGDLTQTQVARRLESYRAMHTAPGGIGTKTGASDIAYQVAIDQEGRVWPLRGVASRSGANGDAGLNALWGAVLLLVGPGEQPSRKLVHAVQDFREDVWLKRYPKATRVVGHRDLHGTACPGPLVYELVTRGVFRRPPAPPVAPKPPAPPSKGTDVAELTTRDIREAVLGTSYREYVDENGDAVRNPRTIADFIVSSHRNTVEIEHRLQALQDVLVARDDAQTALLREIRDAVAPPPAPVEAARG